MKATLVNPARVLFLLLAAVLLGSGCDSADGTVEAEVGRQPSFSVWSVYEGRLEARRVQLIMSEFSGNATISELAPEGVAVEAGDLLVRFDDAAVRREIVNFERDLALAESELESLEQATLPLELRDLSFQLLEAQAIHAEEEQFLQENRGLLEEGLVSEQEVEKQRAKAEQAGFQEDNLGHVLEMTKQYLHPARLQKARANLAAAEQTLEIARAQLDNCTVRAPASGLVVYQPLHIGSDYRTVRVGDNIHRNQVFMTIPDMSDLVVHCHVPEAEMARVEAGKETVVVPLAYADMGLPGRVETVGSMAQPLPGHAGWQKFFRVVVRLDQVDGRLRTGMSVHAKVLTYQSENALVIPRAAVWWEDDRPHCFVKTLVGASVRQLKLGAANFSHFEVLSGLRPGEVTLLP